MKKASVVVAIIALILIVGLVAGIKVSQKKLVEKAGEPEKEAVEPTEKDQQDSKPTEKDTQKEDDPVVVPTEDQEIEPDPIEEKDPEKEDKTEQDKEQDEDPEEKDEDPEEKDEDPDEKDDDPEADEKKEEEPKYEPGTVLASGNFRSNTGTSLNLVTNWTIVATENGKKLRLDIDLEAFSLGIGPRSQGLVIKLDGSRYSYSTDPVDIKATGWLETYDLYNCEMEFSGGSQDISVCWALNGTYSNVDMDNIVASGMVGIP